MNLFEGFDPKLPLVCDVETISWDDTRGALDPYGGDRIAGIALAQGDHSTYIPLRHRHERSACFDYDDVIPAFRRFAADCLSVGNVNIKFDLHNCFQDGALFPKAKLSDLGSLARIVHNRLDSYSLENLTNIYNTKYKKGADEIKRWAQEHNTKDYGAIPILLMDRYARLDALSAYEAWQNLLLKLPKESIGAWESEQEFTYNLFECEKEGFEVDREFLQKKQVELIKQQLIALDKIHKICGYELNPASHTQVNEYFLRQGIDPVEWNEKEENGVTIKTPSWNSDALSQIIHPMANVIIEYNEAKVAYSTFAKGWEDCISPDGRIHPKYNQSGARTSRVTSSDPNVQNPPPWLFDAIKIPDKYIGVKYDYSQIEYRIFAHYSGDQSLLSLYANDPAIDFHQIIADRLGMGKHRKVIKPINFGILYGMGKKKMKKQLAKTIHDMQSDPSKPMSAEEYEKLISYLSNRYGDGSRNLVVIGENIIDEYHKLNPAVKRLLNRVKQVIAQRGSIKDLFGRHFQFDLDKAYVALNYLCQGSAADLFKNRTNAVFKAARAAGLNPKMVMNIHDSNLCVMPIEQGYEYWEIVQREAGKVEMSVPVLVDGELGIGDWGNTVEMKAHRGSYKDTYNALNFN